MTHRLGALALGVIGATGSTDFGPCAQVGTATAVGALAYVAKLLADGRLVAQPVAEVLAAGEWREGGFARPYRQAQNLRCRDSRARGGPP